MTLSTGTQPLWWTMVRPVLNGTRPVTLLYGLGPRAAAQFQGLGHLSGSWRSPYSLGHLYVEQQERVLCHEVPC
ncbi:unnamed protein product [Staurois parvus]|uniref:Uncharacterized protein n=1 Tax=Staurois parvus TaxID=386267 RepID=A0ABN9FJM1_9NEOB|nr:unnamed protein product [Staurois parvus]